MTESSDPTASITANPTGAGQLNLVGRMERLPLTKFQIRLFAIIATAWLFDSIDLAALTFVLAPISKEFHLSLTQAGLVASLSFAGMVVGASGAGMLADRFGRRPVFVTSMIVWGLASFGAAASWDLSSLLVFRFFIGLGMGAEFPVAQALLSEFIPASHRGKYLGWLEGFWPIGFIACGALSVVFVPWLGWRSLFVVEGVLAAFALVIRRKVPESARWYASKGRTREADQAVNEFEINVEREYGKPLPPVRDTLFSEERSSTQSPLAELFSPVYRSRTIMAWTLWFCVLLGYYGITTWMGKLLADQGMTITKSITFVLLMALWGIPGFLTASYLLERLGRRGTVIGFVLLSAAAAYLYGSSTSTVAILVAGSVMQFFFFGMWSALYAYTPEVFPTRARATGCGTSSAFGRVGAILGPVIVPVALVNYGKTSTFAIAAAFLVIGAIAVWVLGPETKGKTLEQVSS